MARILIVQRDRTAAGAFAYRLRKAGLAVVALGTLEEALDAVALGTPDAVVVDLEAREGEGVDGLALARALVGQPTRVMLVAERAPTREQELAVLRLGASELVVRPPEPEDVVRLVERVPARPLGAIDGEGPAEGDAAAWPIERVLTIAERHRLDARLEVTTAEVTWTLGVRDGRVVQAQGAGAQGLAAAQAALRVEAGAWRLELIEPEAATRLGPDVIRRSVEQLASGSGEDDDVAEAVGGGSQRRGTDPGGFKMAPRSVRARVQTDPGDVRRIRRQVGIPAPDAWAVASSGRERRPDAEPSGVAIEPAWVADPSAAGAALGEDRVAQEDRDPPTVPDGLFGRATGEGREATGAARVTPGEGHQRPIGAFAATKRWRPRLVTTGAGRMAETREPAPEASPWVPPPEAHQTGAARPRTADQTPTLPQREASATGGAPALDLSLPDGTRRRRLLTRARLSAMAAGDGALDAAGPAEIAPASAAHAEPDELGAAPEPRTESVPHVAPSTTPEPAAADEPASAPEPTSGPPVTAKGRARAPAGARRRWALAVAAMATLQIGAAAALVAWALQRPGTSPALSRAAAAEAEAPPSACQLISRAEDGVDWATWEARARACLTTEPANAVALARLGVALYEQDRVNEARDVFESLRAAAPGEASLELRLGYARLEAGDRVAAREAFEAFVARAPMDHGMRARVAAWVAAEAAITP